jgi:hypothetical protein
MNYQEHAHSDHPSAASTNAMNLAADMRAAAREHEAAHDERMNNDHTPEATRVLNEREMPAPAARHALAGEGEGLAVPRRFSDFSKTPDLFRHTPV